MDRELAEAVLVRWQEGQPVYEGTLYKAAEALGADPSAVLTEARFYHHLDKALARGDGFTESERAYFSAASGFDPDDMEKTASVYGFESPDGLIVRALKRRNFEPDLEKIAFLGMEGGPTDGGPAMAGPPTMSDDGQPMPSATPQPGAQVQQNPLVRPTPTAPGQVPSAEGGNLESLISQAGQTPGADENGGLPAAGMGASGAPPEPPSAAERLQQAMPAIPPDALERYAPKLEEFEQQVGMTVMDPKQVEKFIKEMQKADKKIIDEAMKQFGEQNAAAMGVGSQPQWDDTAPKPNGMGAGGAPQPQPGGGAPGGAEQQPPATPDAMTKAAAAGVSLARALSR